MIRTWMGWLNFLVLQWFGFRLCRCEENGRIVALGVIAPVLPLTGWWSDCIPGGEVPRACMFWRRA